MRMLCTFNIQPPEIVFWKYGHNMSLNIPVRKLLQCFPQRNFLLPNFFRVFYKTLLLFFHSMQRLIQNKLMFQVETVKIDPYVFSQMLLQLLENENSVSYSFALSVGAWKHVGSSRTKCFNTSPLAHRIKLAAYPIPESVVTSRRQFFLVNFFILGSEL